MELRLPASIRDIARCAPAPHYDGELDCIVSILSDLCSLVERSPGAAFVVSGFGQERWPANAERELCLLLEQLPQIAGALQANAETFEIFFLRAGVLSSLGVRQAW